MLQHLQLHAQQDLQALQTRRKNKRTIIVNKLRELRLCSAGCAELVQSVRSANVHVPLLVILLTGCYWRPRFRRSLIDSKGSCSSATCAGPSCFLAKSFSLYNFSAMSIKFVLLVNKQGQTRLAKYTDQTMTVEERRALEGEAVRRCLARAEKQVSPVSLVVQPGEAFSPALDDMHLAVFLHRAPKFQSYLQAICISLLPHWSGWG